MIEFSEKTIILFIRIHTSTQVGTSHTLQQLSDRTFVWSMVPVGSKVLSLLDAITMTLIYGIFHINEQSYSHNHNVNN